MPSRFENTEALCGLLRALTGRGYRFVTPTPTTAGRMFRRRGAERPDLRDIFGWSRAFHADDIDAELLGLMRAARVVRAKGGRLRSLVRASTVHGELFLHSAFPTVAPDAVFLGPDTYRFANLIARELSGGNEIRTILDLGAGAGVGAIVAARSALAASVCMSDVNLKALDLARANAAHAGVAASVRHASGLEGAPAGLDLVIANPPYMEDGKRRAYRDGGGLHGARLSLEWARAGMGHLAPGGRMILYTGSAIQKGGVDRLEAELRASIAAPGFTLAYRELDPDVFGDELRRPAYADVERIAAIGAVITRSA